MGNNQTTIDLDPYFQKDIPCETNSVITIKVNLRNKETIALQVYTDKLCIIDESEELSRIKFDYEWTPKSHMRDFEVMDMFTEDELMIARGQGIGVVIIEQISSYIKLIYDKTRHSGVYPVHTVWNHSDKARSLLTADLTLGYDVLFISDGTKYNLCEELNEKDSAETMIIFPHLKKYASYDHSGGK